MVAGFVGALCWRHGLALSPDSAEYLFAADSLVKTGGLRALDGSPWLNKPPLYPAFLALGVYLHGSGRCFGAITNGLLAASLAFGVVSWGARRFASGASAWLLALGVVLSPPLLEIFRHLWAETLFVALTLLALVLLITGTERREPWRLLGAGVSAGLAGATRYAGLALAVTLCLSWLIQPNLRRSRSMPLACLLASCQRASKSAEI